jgi:hypothetical protein
LSACGGGIPDLLATAPAAAPAAPERRRAYFIEVKDSSKSPSRRQLTPAQITLHAAFAKAGIPVHA